MKMNGEELIPASRERVWAALNDPEVLKAAIPGCESITKTSPTAFEATVVAKVGPVKAKFGGDVTLSKLNPPESYVISGQGKGGAAGFAKGGASVNLAEAEGGTLLSYTVDAQVGGKLAQIGSRLIDSSARKMAGDFFKRFAKLAASDMEIAGEKKPAAKAKTKAKTKAKPAAKSKAATKAKAAPKAETAAKTAAATRTKAPAKAAAATKAKAPAKAAAATRTKAPAKAAAATRTKAPAKAAAATKAKAPAKTKAAAKTATGPARKSPRVAPSAAAAQPAPAAQPAAAPTPPAPTPAPAPTTRSNGWIWVVAAAVILLIYLYFHRA